MGKTINIGGRIHNPEVGNVVTGANEVLDDTKGKKQSVINGEVDDELLRLGNEKQDNLTFDNTPVEDSTNPITSGGVYASELLIHQVIEAILALIPSAATALNQLADKAFVNSTVATNTSTFRGTYNVVTDLGLAYNASHQDIATALLSHIATADNNDYAFVQIPVSGTSEDIRVTERYKFNGEDWAYEYDLNNSGFTAAQWAAINSGITALLVEKLGALPTAAELATSLAGKQNVLTFDNVPVSGSDNPVKSGGLYQLFTAIDAKFPSDASSSNKLVAENRLAAYVTAIIEALDASFDFTSADGHITFRMTQTNGVIASVQILTSDIASASALTTLGGRVSTNETDIANLQQLYNNLQQSKPVPVTSLPTSGQQQGVIYRLAGTTSYADYMWNGSSWVLMAEYNNAVDEEPLASSDNLAKSGGISANSHSVVIKGNDMNLFYYRPKWLKAGRWYRVKVLKPWDLTNLNYGVFNIIYMKDNVSHFIYPYAKTSFVDYNIPFPNIIDFKMPEETEYDDFYINGRAPSSTFVRLTITDVTEEYQLGYHIGHSVYSGSLTGNGTTAVRFYPRLKPGYKYIIKILNPDWDTSGALVAWRAVFAVEYADSEGTVHELCSLYTSGETTEVQPLYKFVCPDYAWINIALRAKVGEVVNFEIYEIEDTANGYHELLNNNFFVGNGTTLATTYLYHLIPGHTYRVYPKNKSWLKPTVAGGGFFSCGAIRSGVETTLFAQRYGTNNDKAVDFYDFTCPEYDEIFVCGRANVGLKVFFSIIDITDVKVEKEAGIPIMYRGEHFLNKTITSKYGEGIKTDWYSGTSAQGMAIYGNLIFLTVESRYDVYQIGNAAPIKIGSLLSRGVSGSGNHANSCQFAPTIEEGETYPYLYIAEYFDCVCHVERVTVDSGMTVLQTITLSNDFDFGEGANVQIGDDGHIYATLYFAQNVGGDGNIKVVKFRQVAVSEGDVELTEADVVERFNITPSDTITSAAVQGTKVYGGYLYQQIGGSQSNVQGIYKINLMTKQIVSFINFYDFATEEAEDFDIDFSSDTLYSNVIGNFFIKTKF